MNAFRCLRVAARQSATMSTSTLLRPSIARITGPQRSSIIPSTRSISLLAPRRPAIAISTPSTFPAPGTLHAASFPSPDTVDIMGKMSSHPAMGATQIRCGPRDTYNPSHLVRKRRHGFLSRIRTKKGRKLLMRRIKKGRWNLSH